MLLNQSVTSVLGKKKVVVVPVMEIKSAPKMSVAPQL